MVKSSAIQERLPVQIDPLRLAKARQIIAGKLPLKACKRLNQLIYTGTDTQETALDVELEFGVDSEQIHYCRGKIRADLQLICQRCLEPMPWHVESSVNLAFVNNDHEAEKLLGDYEPYILHSVPLVMSDIIEDELLLALPQVPLHTKVDCPATQILQNLADSGSSEVAMQTGHKQQAQDNPFAVLETLHKHNEDND